MNHQQAASAVADLWERFKAKMFNRLSVIEQAVMAALDGTLRDAVRLKAAKEAHSLAGSVGMFGFAEASRAAREIEHILEARAALGRAQKLRLSDLSVILRRELDRPPSGRLLNGQPPDRQRLVLIVDDDVELTERLAIEMALQGARSLVATDAASARAASARERPDLVVLSLTNPERRAITLEFLAELAGASPPIPALVLGGTGEFADRVAVARLGGRGFLMKTLPPSQIVEVASQLLHRLHDTTVRALVVDDDPAVLGVLQAELEPHGIHLTTVGDPQQFWTALEATQPDLLLLDVRMPGTDGLELCRVVRSDPRWSALPVLVLTGHTDAETVRRAFAGGADDFVCKPIAGQDLAARITNRMERVRLVRSASDTDPSTGVASRRRAVDALDQLLRLADRHRQPLCLAVINLDHFNEINARYGYAAGDAVLRRLGALLLRTFRGEDVVGRWQGDAFLLGMYGMTRDDGVHRVAEVLETFREHTFFGNTGARFMATFSAGVAQYPEDGADLPTLHRAAGRALRHAKASGRDRALPATWRPGWTPSQTADVVLVDDDELLARLILYTLETRGYQTQWLRDGEAAAAALTGKMPRLRARIILLDVGLPGLDGFSLLGQLAREGVLRRTRVIIVTVRSVEAEVLRALELGAVDHVAKPFSMPVLMQRVRRTMEGLAG